MVLFSGSVAYLDDENVSACDFVVPIPFMKADADNLKAWMVTPMVDPVVDNKVVTRMKTLSSHIFSIHPFNASFLYILTANPLIKSSHYIL